MKTKLKKTLSGDMPQKQESSNICACDPHPSDSHEAKLRAEFEVLYSERLLPAISGDIRSRSDSLKNQIVEKLDACDRHLVDELICAVIGYVIDTGADSC